MSDNPADKPAETATPAVETAATATATVETAVAAPALDPAVVQARADAAASKLTAYFEGQGVKAEARDGNVVVTVENLEIDPAVRKRLLGDYNVRRKYAEPDQVLPRGLMTREFTAETPKQQLSGDSNTTGRLHRVQNAINDLVGGVDASTHIVASRQVTTDITDGAEPGKAVATVTVPGAVLREDVAEYNIADGVAKRAAGAIR